MKRFIRYLYEYEQGRRMRNVGFVKVESDYEVCTVHIHGKGLRMGQNRKLALYLFYEKDDQCIGILQGEAENVNPAINYRLKFTPQDTGVPENFSKIEGIILESSDGHKYAAVWDDMPVDVNHMKVWTGKDDMPDAVDAEEMSVPNDELAGTVESEAVVVEEKSAGVEAPEADVTRVEVEDTETENDEMIQTNDMKEMQTQDFQRKRSRYKTTKIQRKDLVKLPRCEWKLSNNTFLLHGYYNYHHLVLIEDGNISWIGVPGIYHEKEEKVATAFGFFEFLPKTELEVNLEEDESCEEEQFGYWCRRVKMHPY